MKNKLVILLLAASTMINVSFVAAQKPDAESTELKSLKILAASFCYGGDAADVTERVKTLLREDQIFTTDPDWLEADPHPGGAKTLFICCEINGKPAVFSVGEGEDVGRDILFKKARTVTARTDPQIDLRVKPNSGPADGSDYAKDTAAFPTITTPVDAQGAPVIQTVRLNEHVTTGARRVSGFRFRVDRSEAAARQKVADKTTLDLVWFFAAPNEVTGWYIQAVNGQMSRGFDDFLPMKISAFKNGGELLPKDTDQVVIQRLAADRLKEGEEYIIWFACKEGAPASIKMSMALGYRVDDHSYTVGQDITELSKFLGLPPSGKRVGYEQRWDLNR